MATYEGTLTELFGHDDSIRHVVTYGSGDEGADLDVLVIARLAYPEGTVLLGRLDLGLLTWHRFSSLCHKLDPMAVEPLLTGKHVLGDAREWQALRAEIRGAHSDAAVVSYLTRRAAELYLDARASYDQAEGETTALGLIAVLTNLGFAISCLQAARQYSRSPGREPALLRELVRGEEGRLLTTCRDALRKAKLRPDGIGDVQVDTARNLLDEFEHHLRCGGGGAPGGPPRPTTTEGKPF